MAIWLAALAISLTIWPGQLATASCVAALAVVLLLTSDPPGDPGDGDVHSQRMIATILRAA
jgi:hypothetical protein